MVINGKYTDDLQIYQYSDNEFQFIYNQKFYWTATGSAGGIIRFKYITFHPYCKSYCKKIDINKLNKYMQYSDVVKEIKREERRIEEIDRL